MRVCLAGPPTVEHAAEDAFRDEDSHRDIADRIPLGILTLASAAECQGHVCSLVDLNREFLEFTQRGRRRIDYVKFASEMLAFAECDLLGLGTMCGSYPTTLRIATEVKRLRPELRIVLGGPQASVVDLATMEHFPAIDMIVRGEADTSLPALLDALEMDLDLRNVPGLTYRTNGLVVATPAGGPILDLDALPFPSFEKVPGLEGLSILPIEIGRGCPFSCTFCSTNDFFRRKFRLRTPSTVILQMKRLNERYGTRTFILVHDMFTVDRPRVLEFCRAMIDSGLGFEWSCSARTDFVDDELLRTMHAAGCRGLFFGVETGSARIQRIIDKDLPIDQARNAVGMSAGLGIETTVSMIIGFPEEEVSDVRDSFDFLLESSRFDEVTPQVGLLSPLAKTPLLELNRTQLYFDPVFPDFAYSAWFPDAHRIEMIREHRDIFPNFYALPTKVQRIYLFELKMFFYAGFLRFRWLLLSAHRELGGIMHLFDEWLAYREFPADLIRYYVSVDFKTDFTSFVNRLVDSASAPATRLFLEAYLALTKRPDVREVRPSVDGPLLRGGTRISRLSGNLEEVTIALRRNLPVYASDLRPTFYAIRDRAKGTDLLPVDDIAASVLAACDGSRPAREAIRIATGADVSARVAAAFFDSLKSREIVEFGAS